MTTFIYPTKTGKMLSSEPWPNGNMLYTTAMYLLLKPDTEYKDDFRSGIADCKIKDGLYSRHPDRIENTAIDDYSALSCLPEYAPSILSYGTFHLGFFNSKGFSFKQWLGRYASWWAFMRIMKHGGLVGSLTKKIWAYSLIWASKQPVSHQDGWIQSHMQIVAYDRYVFAKDARIEDAIVEWEAKKPLPTHKIMEAYLNLSSHPLIDAWKPYE